MRKAYKYRLYPTKGQIRILNRMLEATRWVYNEALATRKRAWEERHESLGLYDTHSLLPRWKAERPSLKIVHSQVLQNACVRVDLAFKAFFRRVKAGEEPGYPRFKGPGRYDSLTYPQYGNGVRLEGRHLILSKLGSIKVVLHRPIEGTIKTVTIRRASTGKWYACFSVEVEPSPQPVPDAAVGIDVGLESFATLSNGEKIANPRFFRREEKALAKAQRRLARAEKGTPERAKRRKVVARIHERIANRRRDFAHQHSRTLVNRFGIIAFEDLNVQGMLENRCLAKSIADAAWKQFVQYTMSKAAEAGRRVVLVDPRNTSQRCSRCGQLVQKDVSVRVHSCPVCGLVLDRDENAAINILRLGRQSLGANPWKPNPFEGWE
ncbi:MAG: transposase [Tepidiforma sp.]|uniref:RNA-guided endonuclease InsQ/TnpB family protein n=1 Tax=Tepidiforma sp. TaxID=2682230 RepID=UPI0021DD5D07|nr:transposase [Tepidiforma sp.]GIW16804.1 MAG: transposase [Tepidiforma sp.]